jgi:two-component system, cell cycle sensor histidine kinase and response regulator CckA
MASFLGLQPQTLLQSVLDNVGVALAVIDRERRFVFTNRAALDIFGATENLSVAEWRRNYKFHDIQGREIPPGQAPILRAFAGEEVEPHEVRITLPDGRSKWLHVAGHPFSVMGLTGVLLIVTDETEQIELRRAMEQAQRIEAIGVLAGGLAHDFNNILSVVLGNIALALGDEGVQEITRVRLQEMALALKAGAGLVARLMQYSRAQDAQVRSVQMNDVVNAALELARPLLKSRVRVKTEMSDCLPAVQADFSRLQQVLVNLILNALDAMPEGGELGLCTDLVSSDAVPGRKNEEKNQSVRITVADTGSGIPENLRLSIFDPFFSTKPGGKGAGLGLSSAQAIVRQHNGRIEVQSILGAGTKFSIYLPVAE